jgi:hypothetical protein
MIDAVFTDVVPRLPCAWMKWVDWYIIDRSFYKWERSIFYFNTEWYYQMRLYKDALLIAVVTCKQPPEQ